jgi:hypothetical protein
MGNILGWQQDTKTIPEASGNLAHSLECDFKLGVEKIPRCITYFAKGTENVYIQIQDVREMLQRFSFYYLFNYLTLSSEIKEMRYYIFLQNCDSQVRIKEEGYDDTLISLTFDSMK